MTGGGGEAQLRRIGGLDDAGIDLAEAALVLASLDRPRVSLERYRHHLTALVRDVAEESPHRKRPRDELDDRFAALNAAIVERHGYRGDEDTYDDLQNANLMRVIDRRRGLPVALGILYIHAARAQGWSVAGLNFPAHFLIGLEHGGRRAILDPFTGGRLRTANDLRDFLKAIAGNEAELTPACYIPLSNRAVLLRLQNNIKARLAGAGRIAEAVTVIERMLLFAPGHSSLWRELALLHAELGNLRAAVGSLERFIARTGNDAARHQAAMLMQQLQAKLN
ncbi:MAG: transglutaminase-like domain-containing protein [Alphaproteobacteria bacterium]